MTLAVFNPSKQPTITLTDKAIAFLKHKLGNETQKAIRISVKKSGCTGYAYVIDYGEQPVDGDSQYDFNGLTVFIAAQAVDMIAGSEIDLVQQGLNKNIVFNNPNVTASCGCGSSFSVDKVDTWALS